MNAQRRGSNTSLAHVGDKVRAVRVLIDSGLIEIRRPRQILITLRQNRVHGPAAAMLMKAARDHPSRSAITDEQGTITFRELDQRSDALAKALLDMGIPAGASVGMLARDHRGLLTTVVAAGKAGYQLVMLNTGFAKPQFAAVVRREGVTAVLHDSEFDELLDELPSDLPRIVTRLEPGDSIPPGARLLDDVLRSAGAGRIRLPRPSTPAGITVLTSGTTGLPKGAPRAKVSPFGSAMILDRLPIPHESSVVIATPMFHGTGFALWLVSAGLGNQVVTTRRFDAEATLRSVAENRAELLVAVPTMLSRILDLGPETIARYDLSSLRGVVVAGSALSPSSRMAAKSMNPV
ncbi:AMP-binding protein [Gordonia liuliyuniae]|uniref:AMP-binding protein n=1 Tax=Gordonia liuliyuniae TaxID=2911517 RepID=UPI0027E2008D|nr:AMP-binding protein [Gordonia liuliyuniae]